MEDSNPSETEAEDSDPFTTDTNNSDSSTTDTEDSDSSIADSGYKRPSSTDIEEETLPSAPPLGGRRRRAGGDDSWPAGTSPTAGAKVRGRASQDEERPEAQC